MALARRSTRSFIRPKRTGTNWARGVHSGTTAVIAPSAKFLAGSVVLSNPGIGEVIRRTRGLISITSDQSSIFEQQVGAFGGIVITDTALGQGITAIPSPVTDRNDDGWFVWLSFAQIGGNSSGGTIGAVGVASPQVYEFDSKAMRKVEEGYSVVFVAENGGPHGLEFMMNFSLLSSRIG